MANDNFIEHVDQQALRDVFNNITFDSAGLAEGTNSATIQTARAVSFSIDNIVYYKAATDNIAMTATTAVPTLYTCNWLVTINSSGTVKLTKGDSVLTSAYSAATYALPSCPENEAVLGVMKVVNTSGSDFTTGTTDLGTSGITETFTHLARWQKYAPV